MRSLGLVEVGEPFHLARGHTRHRDTVSIGDAMTMDCRDSAARCQYPGEIERIGGTEHDPVTSTRLPADITQRLHRLEQRELFAAQRVDKSPTANLTTGLPTPEYRQ